MSPRGRFRAAHIRRALAVLLTRAAPCDRTPGTVENVTSSRLHGGVEKEKTA
ncbi:hypothetical protein QZH56_29595 [Streptomyces olivoreticuli]|uniref:hypothetical protein n=1 Tax=Streptomyces olivoreticuli TaxID=68246 RepID=UPI002658C90F|nr:hypothetical protein [Streptomyces olivoreticuli]WKK22870.1 hypothetical protein QZH56_29595 [Streptomyces olivoreticuli]